MPGPLGANGSSLFIECDALIRSDVPSPCGEGIPLKLH